jgi:hypothetical protein
MKKPAFHFDEENLRLLLCPQTWQMIDTFELS